MSSDSQLTKEERRKRVLAEAARQLSSFAFEWQKGLTLGGLSAATGIDQGDISRDFGGKGGLIAELIDYCLNPDNFAEFGEPWVDELREQLAANWLDPSVDFHDAITRTADVDLEYVSSDYRLRSQMAIWAMALDDPKAKAALHRMYRYYDDQHLQLANAVSEQMADAGITKTADINESELLTAMTALIEGLAIRSHVSPDDVTEGLAGRAAAALVSTMYSTDGTTDIAKRLMEQIDRKRRQSTLD